MMGFRVWLGKRCSGSHCRTSSTHSFLHIQEFMRRAEGSFNRFNRGALFCFKTFQCILSRKKIFTLSPGKEAPSILKRCHADAYHVDYKAEQKANDRIEKSIFFTKLFRSRRNSWKLSPALDNLSPYSHTEVQKLVNTIEQILSKR